MNQLSSEERTRIVAAIVEGTSIRSVSRMTGIHRDSIARYLVSVGAACAAFQDKALRNLRCERVQCDEIWSFCYAKDKNVPKDKKGQFGIGSVWTWTALDADSKLICSWMVGDRGPQAANEFMQDLAGRLANRVQLTTDGHRAYLQAVDNAFGNDIDFAQLVKVYGATREGEARYSPAECLGTKKNAITGRPDYDHVSTSYVERQNLTMRMHMRRFTRLTNAFSKKIENHMAAIALHFMFYNFVRVHQTLRVTPAMAAGIADRVMDIADVVVLTDSWMKEQKELAADASYANYGNDGRSSLR